jgi:hypothetical protein
VDALSKEIMYLERLQSWQSTSPSSRSKESEAGRGTPRFYLLFHCRPADEVLADAWKHSSGNRTQRADTSVISPGLPSFDFIGWAGSRAQKAQRPFHV